MEDEKSRLLSSEKLDFVWSDSSTRFGQVKQNRWRKTRLTRNERRFFVLRSTARKFVESRSLLDSGITERWKVGQSRRQFAGYFLGWTDRSREPAPRTNVDCREGGGREREGRKEQRRRLLLCFFTLRMILESACSAGDGPRGIIIIPREEEGKKWESFVQTRRGDLSSKWFRRLHGRQWRKRGKEAAVIIKDILKRLIPGLISKFFSPGCREGNGISPGEKKKKKRHPLERLPMLVDPDSETSDRGGSRETASRSALLWKLDGGGRRRRPATRPDTRGSSSCLQRTRMKKHDGKRAKGRGS